MLTGSPLPGAKACLIKTTLPPDCNFEIIFSLEKTVVEKIKDGIKENIKIKYFTNES